MSNSSEKKYKVYSSNGGLRVTVPKSIVRSMNIEKETFVSWKVKNQSELYMIIDADENDFKIYGTESQFRVSLPKSLANALGITKGSEVKWMIESNNTLILKKLGGKR